MPSKIRQLLEGKDDQIDYGRLIEEYPWIVKRDRVCILSPDSDGFLCGLFMSQYLGWKIVGYYDGKVCLLEPSYIDDDPIFLDMEIFRKAIRSMGHHVVLYNKRHIPKQWANFDNCIQPNILRNYDGKNQFRLKYPLGTIHFLVGIVAFKYKNVTIPDTAIPPLFFTDGVFNVLFRYPENVLNWLEFLRIHEDWHPLKTIFENDKYTVFTLMQTMNEFFRNRDKFSVTKQRGDKLKISNSDGTLANFSVLNSNLGSIDIDAKKRAVGFIELLSETTGWNYTPANWTCWDNMRIFRFSKRDFSADKKSLTNKSFQSLVDKNPLSWAMTSGKNIEYTLEKPDRLFK